MARMWTRRACAGLLIAASPAIIGNAVAQEPPALASHAAAAPHWTYQGDDGPPHWGNILQDYAACAIGRAQSPIEIPAAAVPAATELGFDYRPSSVNMTNNGHTIQVNYDPGSTLTIDGKSYAVIQFHFHAPSEHTIDGVAYPLEMHIVHRADDGALAVVGVLFELADSDNPLLTGFWNVLPAAGQTVTTGEPIDLATWFDLSGPLIAYRGSLTTPPCTEGVNWFVANERLTLSREQLGAFVSVVGINARPVQPLNGRVVGAVGP